LLETGQRRDFPDSWEGSTEVRGREDKRGIARGTTLQGKEQCTRGKGGKERWREEREGHTEGTVINVGTI
jgi:hypothetical protein